MTTVSGIIRDTQGNALPGLDVTIQYKRPLVGYNGGAAVQNARAFTTDGDGLLTMPDLVPGHYDFFVSIQANAASSVTLLQQGKLTVLDQATQTLESAITDTVGIITPSVLQQAIDARDAAEGFRDDAEAAADSINLDSIDITGGTIDGTVIGGSTPAAINGTTGSFSGITATGDVTIPDRIIHAGDTNTQVRFPAADTVTVETNGDERLRVDSSGNVGIGTSSPAAKLDVSADATIHGATVGRGAGAISTNTAVGNAALLSNTTGNSNTAAGFQALQSNTEGSDNTAAGRDALQNNTTGSNNTANGRNALLSNTTGSNNTANGYQALQSNTTGNNNTANGLNALQFNTTGNNNTANGYRALRFNTTGFSNTANGIQALQSNTTGNNNTANGLNALQFNTTGNNNTADGYFALRDNTTGFSNTATGRNALQSNTTGSNNTANGRDALLSNTEGSNNTANGRQALQSNTTGNENTANGVQALQSNTTGDNNTATGNRALFSNTTGTDNTATGNRALFSNTTGINNIGIGKDAGRSISPFTVTTQDNRIVLGNNDHTHAYIKVSWTVTSDARDKAEIAPIPHGLDFVNALQPTEYQFKAGGRDGEADGIRRYGFLAQDVLEAEGDAPVIVDAEDPESLKLHESHLVPVLVNAVQELTEQVNNLKAEVAALKEK